GEEALAEKDRDGDPECTADREPEERRVNGSPDRGQDAELPLVGVPRLAGQEAGAVGLDRGQCGTRDVPYHVDHQGHRGPRDQPRAGTKEPVGPDLACGRWPGDRIPARHGVRLGPDAHVPSCWGIDLLGSAHHEICSSAFVTAVTTFAGSGMYPSSSLN